MTFAYYTRLSRAQQAIYRKSDQVSEVRLRGVEEHVEVVAADAPENLRKACFNLLCLLPRHAQHGSIACSLGILLLAFCLQRLSVQRLAMNGAAVGEQYL